MVRPLNDWKYVGRIGQGVNEVVCAKIAESAVRRSPNTLILIGVSIGLDPHTGDRRFDVKVVIVQVVS